MIGLRPRVSAIFIVLVFATGVAFGAADVPPGDFEGLRVVLKATTGMNRKVRVEVGGKELYYIYGASNLFPCRQPEPVTIGRVQWHGENADVYFKSSRLGSGQIRFFAPGGRENFGQLFWGAFAEVGSSPDTVAIIGNSGSHMYHLTTCNHLPDASDRVAFDSTIQATEAGYRECPLCFEELPRLRDFLLERQLGIQAAAQVRSLYPPIVSEEKQNRLNAIGERVLSRWPSPLKGYDYSFLLVESDVPNAFAVPGGKIFLTSAIYEQAESDSEIEAILAHEITHVEKRHGYRQYRSAQRAAMWASAAAVVGGVLTARSGGSPTAVGEVVGAALLLGQLASGIILTGYAKENEEEADAYANIYFVAQKDEAGKRGLVQVLKKLKYSDELLGRFEDSGSAFASHPGIDDRIDAATNSLVGEFSEDTVFQGTTEDGKLVATLHLEMQRSWKNPGYIGSSAPAADTPTKPEQYSMLATLYTTAELGKPCEIKKIRIDAPNGKMKLENAEKTEVHPLETVGILFVTTTEKRELLEKVTSVDLDLPHVKAWSRAGGGS